MLQANSSHPGWQTGGDPHRMLAAQGKNKLIGLPLTFIFPVFGFLYSTNYLWAVFALCIDILNFFLLILFGFGLFTGLLWRFVALIISNYGIDRYRRRKLRRLGYQV